MNSAYKEWDVDNKAFVDYNIENGNSSEFRAETLGYRD